MAAQADIVRAGFLVLGAALALGGGIIVEIWRVRRDDMRKLALVKRLLEHDVPSIINIVKTGLWTLERQLPFPRACTESINRYLLSFDHNKAWALLIIKDQSRNEIFEYYMRVNTFCRAMEGVHWEGINIEAYEELIARATSMARTLIEDGGRLLKLIGEL